MKNFNRDQRIVNRLLWLFLVGLLIHSAFMASGAEEKFDVLKTKTDTYHNVTVTKKTKEWVFILHAAGMVNIKITDLSPETRHKLGYDGLGNSEMETSTVEEAVATPVVAEAAATPQPAAAPAGPSKLRIFLASLPARFASGSGHSLRLILLVIGLPIHLFFSLCCRMICRKTHISPGFLIWLPILQWIPLFRAANMSPVWLFLPGVNSIAMLIWCFKIVQERGKGMWVSILLLLPVTNIFAFLYLAFSDEAPAGLDVGGSSALVLQTA